MNIDEITKCEFERVYQKYAPSKLEKFFFKYFSTSTLQKHRWACWVVALILSTPLLISFIQTISNGNQYLICICTYIFCGLMVSFAIPWIAVWFMHDCRIKKIQRNLDINSYEYEYLLDKFYNEVDLNKYIKNKICQ